MIELAAQVVPLKINAEKEGRKLAAKYGVRPLPTIVFIDHEGELDDTIIGYKGPEAFANFLKDLNGGALRKARTRLKSKPDDGETNARVASLYAQLGKLEDAEAAIDKAKGARYKGALMGQAGNNLGDAYRVKKDLDKAVDAYRRADLSGGDAVVRGYAKMRLMECYQAKGDDSRAERTAKSLARLKGAPKVYVDAAEEYLGD